MMMKKVKPMNVSLSKAKNSFENLQVGQIYALLDVLKGLKMRNLDYVKRRFSEKAQYFEETLKFLVAMKAIAVSEDKLKLMNNWEKLETVQIKELLLNSLLKYATEYRKEISNFLGNFKVLDERVIYHSNPLRKSYEQSVRNFLMDLDILTYESLEDRYSLTEKYIDFYATSQDYASFTSISELENILASNERVGLSAEERMVSYEKTRLGQAFSHEVVHVSKHNTAAGYDVRSISLCEDGKKMPRFIEVKAVSLPLFQFYWTENEIKVARKQSKFYYLYLLPVKERDTFDIENLKIVRDPWKVITSPDGEWVTEPNVTRCYLKA